MRSFRGAMPKFIAQNENEPMLLNSIIKDTKTTDKRGPRKSTKFNLDEKI